MVDNFQLIEDADEQQELLTLIRNCKNKRFVILSRGVPSGWLAPFQFSGLMQIFNARDLLFDRTATGKYFEMLKMELTAVELTAVHKECWGYPPAISFYAQRFKKASLITPQLPIMCEGIYICFLKSRFITVLTCL